VHTKKTGTRNLNAAQRKNLAFVGGSLVENPSDHLTEPASLIEHRKSRSRRGGDFSSNPSFALR
jgi:hypothetical protein